MATVPTAFDTFAASEVVTATKLNKNVRDAGNFFRQVPSVSAGASAVTSAASSTYVKPALSVLSYDTDAMWDAANARVVIKTAGVYLITACVTFAANSTGGRYTALYINGTVQLVASSAAAAAPLLTAPNLTAQRRFAVNDIVELYGYQTSGAALNMGATPFLTTHIDLTWMGA